MHDLDPEPKAPRPPRRPPPVVGLAQADGPDRFDFHASHARVLQALEDSQRRIAAILAERAAPEEDA